jgi:hypothetical protein
MGHWLRCNLAITHIETVSRADDDTLLQPLEFRASGGARGQENGEFVSAGERSDASAVIAMLVRHQNGINLTCRDASCEQSLFSFFPRKTTVDEEERLACVD